MVYRIVEKELQMMWKIKCLDMFNAPLPLSSEREKEGEAVEMLNYKC